MQLRTVKAQFAVEFVDLPSAALVEGARWEAFQIAFLNNSTRFGLDVKARQIAWSFTAALDAVVDGILNHDTPHVFVSINLDEAKEKIRYAKAIIEAIDEPVRPALVRSGLMEIELANGSRSRLAGFYTINEERLNALGGSTLERLCKAGHLQAVYMAIASLSQFRALIERQDQFNAGER